MQAAIRARGGPASPGPLLGAKSHAGSTLLRSAPSNKYTDEMGGFYGYKVLIPSSIAEACGMWNEAYFPVLLSREVVLYGRYTRCTALFSLSVTQLHPCLWFVS
jgi:hypothetical protein